MRRGFKSWCETTSANYRNALQLRQDYPLAPEKLAAYLGITVWGPEDVPELPETSLHQLTIRDPSSWSAVTLRLGDISLIIVNSAHALNRRRSSLTHELAHIILRHDPGRIDLSPQGHLLLSSFEREQEDEADWLAATLLVPREGLRIRFQSTRDYQALARHFGVSLDMLNWRLRMTGIPRQERRVPKWPQSW